MKLIALTGRSRSGKTTVANSLVSGIRPPGECGVVSFSRPIREFLSSLQHGKSTSPLFRKLAQEVGDVCRQVKPDIFSRSLVQSIRAGQAGQAASGVILSPNSISWLVVDDLRYPSELNDLKAEFGAENVAAFRLDRVGSGLTGGLAAHSSETQNVEIPAVDISNNSQDNGLTAASEVFLRASVAFCYRPRIYLAGPITLGDRNANCRAAIRVAESLRRLNFPVFIPHLQITRLHQYQLGDAEYYRGLSESLTFLHHWAELVVYLSGESPGRDRELKEARRIGLFCLSWDEVRGVLASAVGDSLDGQVDDAESTRNQPVGD